MKKVSVIIGCYNAADDLHKCWDSLKTQTIGLDSIECIFIDDASGDDKATWNKLTELESEAPDSVVIIGSESNLGPGGARNLGLRYATGKYMQFLDADDELESDAMEKLYDTAERYDTDIIQFNHRLIMGEQSRVNRVSAENKLYDLNAYETRCGFLNSTMVTYGCTNKFYRMSLVKETGAQFAEHVVYEEPKFVYPLFVCAKKVYLMDEALYRYYLHEGSTVTSRLGKDILDHPKVQLQLLLDLMQRPEYSTYRDVIGCYFLWSFYCETFIFASEHADSFLPFEYVKEMQLVCRTNFPDWRDNPFIKAVSQATHDLLETIDTEVTDQKQVAEFIQAAAGL